MPQPKVLDLNEVVAGMEDMLGRVLDERIVLATGLDAELGRTRADLRQIEQVLLNLAINARDAIPRGGRLTIKTANVALDAAFVAGHVGPAPGEYVMLAVSDTGTGMDRETLERVFVYLPRVWEEATLAPPPADRPQLAGTETVLLVEDEEIVRSLVGEMLSSAGYRELEAPDGGAALELAAGTPSRSTS